MPRRPEIGNVQLYPDRPLNVSDRNGYVLKFYCPIQAKRIRRACGTRDRREARRVLRECRERLLDGQYVESKGAITSQQAATNAEIGVVLTTTNTSELSWQDCYDRYRKYGQTRMRDRSLTDALYRLSIAERILESYRKKCGLSEEGAIDEYINLDSLEYLQDRLLAGDECRFDRRSPMTVNTTIGAVMAFVRFCHKHEWIEKVPELTKLPVEDMMKGRPVTEDEFRRMLDTVPKVVGKRNADSWQFTLKILWESAFRMADVMDFSWDDDRHIHPVWSHRKGDHPTLIIPSSQKNRKSQEIPMLPGLRELLDEIPSERRSGWVANPQRSDSQVRSSADWFKPTTEDLASLSITYSNSAIARACGVTETAVRKWLQTAPEQPTGGSRGLGEIPPERIVELRERPEQDRADLSIQSIQRLTKEHVSRVISRIGEEAGVIVQQENPKTGRRQKYASAHDLRRGCARRLINAGVSAETLKIVLRHKDFATTEKFYGATRAAQSAAAELDKKLTNKGRQQPPAVENEEIAQLSTDELRKLKALLSEI